MITSTTAKSGVRLCVIFAVLALSTAAAAERIHFITRGNNEQALTPESLTQRIRDAAVKYKPYAPVPRIAFYDIAYPNNESELQSMRGYAVLLITAICQDNNELPLRRVYVEADGKTTELVRLATVSSTVRKRDDPELTFGQFRLDALYLVPIDATVEKGFVLGDFAAHREGFKIAQLADLKSDRVAQWKIPHADSAPPSDDVLEKFVRREYPAFLAQ